MNLRFQISLSVESRKRYPDASKEKCMQDKIENAMTFMERELLMDEQPELVRLQNLVIAINIYHVLMSY